MNIDRDSSLGQVLVTSWRGLFAQGQTIETYLKWSLAGVGATVSLMVSNLEPIANVTNTTGLKCSFVALIFSLVFGFASVLVAHSIRVGYETGKRADEELKALKSGKAPANDQEPIDPQELKEGFLAPFWGPVHTAAEKAWTARLGGDTLYAEKYLINRICWNAVTIRLHWLFALIGVLIVAFSIE